MPGGDRVDANRLSNRFGVCGDSIIASAKLRTAPIFIGKPFAAMSVFSSAQSAVRSPESYPKLGSGDLIHATSDGIMANPDVPAAGAQSLCDAWDAAIAGVPAADHADDHPAHPGSLVGDRT